MLIIDSYRSYLYLMLQHSVFSDLSMFVLRFKKQRIFSIYQLIVHVCVCMQSWRGRTWRRCSLLFSVQTAGTINQNGVNTHTLLLGARQTHTKQVHTHRVARSCMTLTCCFHPRAVLNNKMLQLPSIFRHTCTWCWSGQDFMSVMQTEVCSSVSCCC